MCHYSVSRKSKPSQPSPVTPAPDLKCKRSKMKLIWKIVIYGVGSVLLILGLAISGFWEHLYRHILAKNLVLSNSSSSQSYSTWSSNTVPVYFKVYLFNLTNKEEVLLKGAKPSLEQLGPYVYRISQIKENIVWNDHNSTVTYLDRRRWDFVPEKSSGSMTDTVTSINAVALTLMSFCKNCNKLEKFLLNNMLKYNEKTPFATYTIEDVLFAGAGDRMLNLVKVCKKVFKNLKDMPDEFAWYYGKNVTESHIFNIYTGKSDINKLGLLHSWNYKTECKVYEGACDQVRGSPGDLWPMNAPDEDKARLFIPDFCSNFPLKNVGASSVHNVKGIKFEGNPEMFDNGTKNADAACYCPGSKCDFKSGVRNVTACLKSPVFVSYPHFYGADKSYREAVRGLNPQPEKHKFHFTLQKDSGFLIDISARLQINLLVEQIPGFDFLLKTPKVYLPVFWFEESADIPPNLVAQLQFFFNTLPFWFSIVGFILVAIGTILLVIAFLITRFTMESIPYTRRLD